MKTTRIPMIALVAGALLAWGCSEAPTESAIETFDATADAKPPWAGGGDDDGGDSGLTSLAVTLGAGSLMGDGQGAYVDRECGVEANWEHDPSFFDFRPLMWLNKKQERDIADDADCYDAVGSFIFPRSATIDLANAVVRSYCVAPASQNECAPSETITPPPGTSLAQLAATTGDVDAPDPNGHPFSTFATRLFDANRDGDPSTAPGGLNTEYCLDDGTGRPLRFDPERNPGSHELLVTTASDGRPTRVESQPSGNNVGSCAHTRSDGTLVVLNLELDVLVDLAEAGS